MFHRRPQPKNPRRPFLADSPLIRAGYHAALAANPPRTHLPYPEWLATHGIDPATGKMNPEGLAFFKQLLDDDRAGKRRAAPTA